jgi:hypothetical protein
MTDKRSAFEAWLDAEAEVRRVAGELRRSRASGREVVGLSQELSRLGDIADRMLAAYIGVVVRTDSTSPNVE